MLIDQPMFYALALPAILLTGVSKSGFPGAFSGISVPLLALVIPPAQAVGVMLPLLIMMDLYGLSQFWRHFDRRLVLGMIPGATLGMLIGWATFRLLDDNLVRVIVGSIAIAYPIIGWLKPVGHVLATRPHAIKGTLWSTVSGYTSFVVHAGAAPVMIYMLPMKLDRVVFAATAAVFFAFVNLSKLPGYALLGQLSLVNLSTALVLCPLVPVGIRLGMWLQGKVSNEQFYLIARCCIVVTGGKLLFDGLRNLAGW
jgi:uncharacterized membrane protein YfcA